MLGASNSLLQPSKQTFNATDRWWSKGRLFKVANRASCRRDMRHDPSATLTELPNETGLCVLQNSFVWQCVLKFLGGLPPPRSSPSRPSSLYHLGGTRTSRPSDSGAASPESTPNTTRYTSETPRHPNKLGELAGTVPIPRSLKTQSKTPCVQV